MAIKIQSRSWGCPNCPYYQQFDPLDPILVSQNFPECPDLPVGSCPACWMGRNPQRVKQTSELGLLLTDSVVESEVAEDDDIEQQMVEELDEHGQPVMIQTGERYELRVNQQTGAVYSEAVPVYEPKMREMTQAEINALKEQRDNDLRELEKIAV